MKEMKKKTYLSPETEMRTVEMECGFMTASIFDKENQQDNGVSIESHEVGNTGDYTDLGWDNASSRGFSNEGF